MTKVDPDAPRYFIETWGCQMNVHDSEKLAGALEGDGYRAATDVSDADVILLNTCSIREKAAEKVFSEVGRLRALKEARPGLVIGVCGCVAQQEGEAIVRRAPVVDLVVGPRATASLGPMLAEIRAKNGSRAPRVDTEYRRDSIEFPHRDIRRTGLASAKAYVTIIEGCNHRCTYCIVPTTRGREVYRAMPDVLDEVRTLARSGVVEIEFLGQTVNAYRDPDGNTLADLLPRAAREDGIRRIRFTTSHPAQMTESLIDAMADGAPAVCPYLHLPVQSGSSRVLADMRRGYDRASYLDRIASLRNRIPNIVLGTDVIVGFPTETEEHFQETLTLLDEVQFDTCYSFAYSPRPGTKAAALDDPVPLKTKFERLARLQAHQKGIQERRAQEWIGAEVEVLVEGVSKRNARRWSGRTPEYRVVHFEGDVSPGEMVHVRIEGATAFSMRGTLLSRNA